MQDLPQFRRHDRAVSIRDDDAFDRLRDWARFAVRVALIPAVIWGINLERRVSVIEATRVSSVATSVTHGDLYLKLAGKADLDDVPGPETLRRLEALERRVFNSGRGSDR